MASKQGLKILFKGSKFDSLLFDFEGRLADRSIQVVVLFP
jgi:hypothetical protein